jgi:hypothetical protein
MSDSRQSILNRANKIIREIEHIFTDAKHWNENTRPLLYPDAEPINPDPDGKLARCKQGLEEMLRNEARLGNFPS